MDDLADLNQKYRRELKPVLEMLKHKKTEMSVEDWMTFVRMTEQRIIAVPDQYLTDFRHKNILETIINSVFIEFLNESLH